MPNYTSNSFLVIGPEEDVQSFVEAAKGMTSTASNPYGTQFKVIEEVRSGVPVADAFRNANIRIEQILMELDRPSWNIEMTDTAVLKPVSEADFYSWCEEMRDFDAATRNMMSKEKPVPTSFSLDKLVPMPAEVEAESDNLVGMPWRYSQWGAKDVLPVDEPTIMTADEAAIELDLETSGNDETVAFYRNFSAANGNVFAGLRKASENHPSLLFVSASLDSDEDKYHWSASMGGIEVQQGEIASRGDLPKSCFEGWGGEKHLLHDATLNHMLGTGCDAVARFVQRDFGRKG